MIEKTFKYIKVIDDFLTERMIKWAKRYYMEEQAMAVVTYLGDGVGKCKCSKCGKRIDKTDNYCRFCGRKIIGTKITRG